MDHHLKEKIRHGFRSFDYVTDQAWNALACRIEIALGDPGLMSYWGKFFNYCENYNSSTHISHYDDTPVAQIDHATPSRIRTRHHYMMKDKAGLYIYVRSMTPTTRDMIPDFNLDIPSGSFLAGMHGMSINAGKQHFDDYKKYCIHRFGNALSEFVTDYLPKTLGPEECFDRINKLALESTSVSKPNIPEIDSLLHSLNNFQSDLNPSPSKYRDNILGLANIFKNTYDPSFIAENK